MTALTAVVVGCAATVPLIFFLLSNKDVAFYLLLALAAGVIGYLLYTGLTLGKVVLQRITALIVLLFANALFWACFEQAGNSLNFFAQNHVGNREIFGVTFLFEWFQSVNPVYIVLFGPVFAWLWVWLARRNLNPSIPPSSVSAWCRWAWASA
jgi:POT family proton-dependent oligopeptide transporter